MSELSRNSSHHTLLGLTLKNENKSKKQTKIQNFIIGRISKSSCWPPQTVTLNTYPEIWGYLNILEMIRSPLRFKPSLPRKETAWGQGKRKVKFPGFLPCKTRIFSSLLSLATYEVSWTIPNWSAKMGSGKREQRMSEERRPMLCIPRSSPKQRVISHFQKEWI